MDSQLKALVPIAVLGLVAGYLASFIVRSDGILTYLVSGVVGAFIGGYVINAFANVTGLNASIKNPLVSQLVSATVGAVIVVLLARLIK